MTIDEAVAALRSGFVSVADATDMLFEHQALGEEEDQDIAGLASPPAEDKRPRNPFKHPQVSSHGYLGPGPKGMIHVPSAVPWRCSGHNYKYTCQRTLPDGSVQTRQLNYDQARVSQRNASYREFAKARTALQQAKKWPVPLPLDQARSLYPMVTFKSHF